MIHLILFAALTILPAADADEPAAYQPAATLETARSRIEPLAAAVRLDGGGVLAWTPAADKLMNGADSTPFEQWIRHYAEQADPTQAVAWRQLAVELRCQFQTLTVYRWEEPCENCHTFKILITGQATWGSASLAGSISWDS